MICEFEVGETVVVRHDLDTCDPNEHPSIIDDMLEETGNEYQVIRKTRDSEGTVFYQLNDSSYFIWLGKWLIPVEEDVDDAMDLTTVSLL